MLPPRRIVPFAWLILVLPAAAACAAEAPLVAGRIPYLQREWAQPLSREEPARQWVRNQAVRYLEAHGRPVLPAFEPLAVGNTVVFRSHWGIHAVNLRTGKLEWESDSRWGSDRMMHDPATAGALTQWLAAYANAGHPSVVLDSAALGTLTTDGQRIFAVEDVQVPPLRVLDSLTGEERWSLQLSETSFPSYASAGTPDRPVRVPYHAVGHVLVLSVGRMAFGIDALGHRLLWERNLLGSAGGPEIGAAALDPRDGMLEVVYPDGWVQALGQARVLGTGAACVLTRDGLLGLDPYSGAVLWSRSDVGLRSRFFGDGDCLYVLGRDAEGTWTGSSVLRAADGSRVRAPDFTALYEMRRNAPGRRLLLEDRSADGQVLLRLHDARTGRGLWRRQFPAGSRVLRSEDPTLTGAVDPHGAVTVIDLPSGREIVSARLDARRLAGVTQLHVLQDAALVYVFGSSPPDSQTYPGGGLSANVQATAGVHLLPVNGWVCAFDRTTGKRTWEADVRDQMLLLDRFADLPVLLFTGRFQKLVVAGNFRGVLGGAALKVIDKRTGKLLYDRTEASMGPPFYAVRISADARRVTLVGPNRQITVAAEE